MIDMVDKRLIPVRGAIAVFDRAAELDGLIPAGGGNRSGGGSSL